MDLEGIKALYMEMQIDVTNRERKFDVTKVGFCCRTIYLDI
jgi:hypothetical protein